MNPSLNDILEKGSASFRRLNSPAAGQVLRGDAVKSRPRLALAAPVSLTQPKPDQGRALEQAGGEEGGGISPSVRRPNVHIALHRVRLLDRDNKWASVKFLVDGLCKAGLIKDDSEQDIDLRVTQTKVDSYSKEGTGVVITYRET